MYPQWDVDLLMAGQYPVVNGITYPLADISTNNADLVGRYPAFLREADHNAGTGHYFDCTAIDSRPELVPRGTVDTYGLPVSINARKLKC